MKKKISVVIPTWQRPALLENCLLALTGQHLPAKEFEIIVVTDGPDEASMQAVNKIQLQCSTHFLKCIALAGKKGPAAARNLGWQQAEGTLIAFTDDDCIPHADWLSTLWDAYLERKRPTLIAFAGKVKVPLSESPTDFEMNTSHLETANFVTANCCCTRAALVQTGGFDESFTMAWREDSDLEFKLLRAAIPIYHLERAIITHPVRQAPWGVSIKEQKKSMFNALLYKKYPRLYREKIQPRPATHYYIILCSFMLMLLAWIYQSNTMLMISAAAYIILTGSFIAKRLARTSRSFRHVTEMIFTSIVIPFASVYWTLYGAWKYRVLFF
ncbi:MAG TPA: glycosyltransferase [Chitinophagaceae bacterium]|nr:glycosyltransferase [Chitinophagaceae bacterium]